MTLPKSRWALLALAAAIGATIVITGNVATDLVLRRVPLADGTLGSIDAGDVAVLHVVFASLPMVVLAWIGSRSKRLWLTAALLTICFEAYFVYQIWRDSLTGFAGGANIGLGLIMLASPLVILAVVGIVAAATRRPRP